MSDDSSPGRSNPSKARVCFSRNGSNQVIAELHCSFAISNATEREFFDAFLILYYLGIEVLRTPSEIVVRAAQAPPGDIKQRPKDDKFCRKTIQVSVNGPLEFEPTWSKVDGAERSLAPSSVTATVRCEAETGLWIDVDAILEISCNADRVNSDILPIYEPTRVLWYLGIAVAIESSGVAFTPGQSGSLRYQFEMKATNDHPTARLEVPPRTFAVTFSEGSEGTYRSTWSPAS